MLRLLTLVSLVVVALGVGAVAALRFDLAWLLSNPSSPQTTALTPPLQAHTSSGASDGHSGKLEVPAATFDVVRIDPDRSSVFAGRAAPGSRVTILADGRPVVTAYANEDGEWAVVSEHPFTPGEHQLSLRTENGERGSSDQGQGVHISIAARPQAAAGVQSGGPAEPVSAATANSRVIAGFERMVASARSGEATQPLAAPVPITFVYNEATFTANGRRGVELLAEYLRLRHLETTTLTGHADERGSEPYNMELSRQRLEVVARYLRERGFAGKLVLIPKGKSEPFMGVDRARLPKEELFQVDRRVEFHPQ